ncbi:MAG: hypothetical protein ACRDJW_12295 [Thermomicrobiales bacterium]
MTTDEAFPLDAAKESRDDLTAELLEQAQSNAQAAIIATVAFLQEEGIPLARWTESLGRAFALGWDEPRPWEAGEFLEAMLINLGSLGARIVTSDLGIDHAEATTTGFPDADLCALFGVEVNQVARFNDATVVFARDRGLAWEWTLDGDETCYTADRIEE